MLDLTVNAACPLALLMLLPVAMLALPFPERDTCFPATGLLPASFRVTVMVEVVVSSAGTAVGDAVTVEVAASTPPPAVANGVSSPV